jgi:hypothetical protein
MTAAAITVAMSVPAIPAAQALGQSAKKTTITVIGSDAVIGINDNNLPGPTPGDIRTLSLALSDKKGVALGRAEIVQTLTRQQGDIGTAVKIVVLNLPKGTITAMGTTDFVNFTDKVSRPNDAKEHIAVVGGTGAYRGASGQIDITLLPSFASRWVVTLEGP